MPIEGVVSMGPRLSHAAGVHPYPEAVKVREPVARPLDVVAVELLLSASQAFLVGVLMYLAIGIWDDRGVGLGSVAVILAMLGLGVGGAWLFWLLGGVGWPLAAANVPVAMFLGFALVLGWRGDDLIRVDGAPLLLAALAAVYGIVCGVFVDSPRRWRWDQRQKLRPGTEVPRVSPTTKAFVAQVPRSLPRRSASPEPVDDLATRIEHAPPAGADTGIPDTSTEPASGLAPDDAHVDGGADVPEPSRDASKGTDESGLASVDTAAVPERQKTSTITTSTMPTERLQRGAREGGSSGVPVEEDEEPGSIELPTSIEPKAQRSPWAWAAPPEWNRDEDDEPDRDGSSGSP